MTRATATSGSAPDTTSTSGSAPASTSTVEPQPQDQKATTSDQTDSTSEEPIGAQGPPSSAAKTFAQTLSGRDGDPVDVVVLGDDTSNLRSEWVQLWGQGVAGSRQVTVVQWAEVIDIHYAEPDVLSDDGEGGPLTIWSASRTGGDIESVTQRLELFLEPDPDLVVISLGANNDDAGEAVQQMEDLVDDLADRIGGTQVALMRQGEGGASDDVDQALADWAQAHDLFVIDARSADSAREWAELVIVQTSDQ